ncbi:MAG: hypothetical protein J5747_06595 [Spirochaetaceae bacterium]|nr:hypothetical protein [Spirochaetaceae bacterium]
MLDFLRDDVSEVVTIEKLSEQNLNDSFTLAENYAEYKDFLYKNALDYQNRFISKTYLLIENKTRNIIAYISLASDTVAMKPQEKKKIGIDDIPFLFMPAIKITKLAVSSGYSERYKNIGSYLVAFARLQAYLVNEDFMSCRVLSVDADIEHNPGVLEFYKKNGFVPLKSNIYKRKFPHRTKIIGMWKDIID